MKAYRFRLDSVLRVRRLQEQAATQRLAASIRALHHAEFEADLARRALEGMTAPTGRLTVGAVEWAHAQSTRASETACQRAEVVETAVVAARQANDEWSSARQRTATLERLDERHRGEWRREFDRTEASALDDLAAGRRLGGEVSP